MRINTNYAVHGCTNVAGAGCTGATQYDNTGKLTALQNQAFLQVSYHYDGAGRLIDRILSNGAKTRYQYDDDNRLTQLINSSANGTEVENLNYQQDEVGNITQISNSTTGKVTDYQYDALYRLINVDSTDNTEDRTYSYDKVGNRKTETKNGISYYYCYHETDCTQPPQGNRLFSIRTGSPTGSIYRQFFYDTAGRINAKTNEQGQLIYGINYNAKGRAQSITTTNGSQQFEYDPNDYRIKKDNQLYHLEGEHLEATYSNTGELKNSYFRGVIVDEIVSGYTYHSQAPGDWTNYTFHHDHLNSVTALTGHNGTIEDTTRYDAFGEILNPASLNSGNELLYTGRQFDRETGLVYYRARYYDTEIDRFITEDPLGLAGGDINYYSYCTNSPINCNDPSGKVLNFVAGALIGGGGELAAQYLESVITGNEFSPDLSRIVVAAGVGATGVGIGNLAARFGSVGSAAIAGVSEIGLNVGQEVINTGSFDAINNLSKEQAVLLGLTGVGSSVAGNAVANRFLSSDAVQIDLRQADRLTRIGQNRINEGLSRPSRAQARFDQADSITNAIDQAAQIRSTVTGGLIGATSGTGSKIFDTSTQGSASGGFVLYPSKPNTNMLQSVYSK